MSIVKAICRAVAGFSFGVFFGIGIAIVMPFAWAIEAARGGGDGDD